MDGTGHGESVFVYADKLGDTGPDDAVKSDSGKEAERTWGKA